MITGNEPAFAKSAYVSSEGAIDPPQEGLSIRQHFAAMAMQGLCSNDGYGQSLNIDDYDDYNNRLVSHSIDLAKLLIEKLNEAE